MKIQKFEDIIAWQKAQDLAVAIYKEFEKSTDYGFKNQIQRATISISNNIAEGFDRNSDKEFIHFLYILSGSCSEVRSMLYLSVQLNFISSDKVEKLINQTNEISKIIRGLIKSIAPQLTTNN
ncbi:four helix bundle protein [Flavobacterium sp.]|uniref:four helix bundle protein n=1 Tax=Flavobacterium sp. TaxID=239 RepID=UPI00374CF637